jgi:hypothetical protein
MEKEYEQFIETWDDSDSELCWLRG